MTKPDDPANQAQLKQLIALYEKSLLSKENLKAALTGMGMNPAEMDAVFNQIQQQVDHQTNIGEMSGGLAQPGSEFQEDVQQAGRDFHQINIDARRFDLAPEPGASPESLQKAYLNRLVLQIYRLPLAGVDPKVATDKGSRELELSAVYTALMTHRPETDGNLRHLKTEGHPKDASRRLSALAVLNKEPRLAMLGDPGSGKSTFVNFVALCMAGEALGQANVNLKLLTAPLPEEEIEERAGDKSAPRPQSWDHGFLLPVRIVLRDFAARGLPDSGQPADGETLWNFIIAELGGTLKEYSLHLKKTLLEKGALILLDGLDEVPDADRRRVQVKQAVQSFAMDFSRCRFLITSRTYAYQRQDWKLDGFDEAVLSDFSPSQIARFIDS
jgi:hypothetical protein